MAYDLEEQEQLESLKHWWRDNGNVVTWIVIVVLLALAGWFGWKNWQRKQAGEASVLYEQVQKAVDAKDAEKIKRAAADMEDKFGRTAYAQMGALSAAKALYEANDAAGAKAQLQWTIDHAGDDEYKAVAKLRLAGLLLDEGLRPGARARLGRCRAGLRRAVCRPPGRPAGRAEQEGRGPYGLQAGAGEVRPGRRVGTPDCAIQAGCAGRRLIGPRIIRPARFNA